MNTLEAEMAEFEAWMNSEATADEVSAWKYSLKNIRSSNYPEHNNMFIAYLAGKAGVQREAALVVAAHDDCLTTCLTTVIC